MRIIETCKVTTYGSQGNGYCVELPCSNGAEINSKQLHEPNAYGFHIRYEYDLSMIMLIMNIGNYNQQYWTEQFWKMCLFICIKEVLTNV